MSKLLILYLLIFPFCCFAQIQIPEGFVELKKSNGETILPVHFLFDSDDVKDEAVIVKGKENPSFHIKLLIYLSSQDKQYEIDLENDTFQNFPLPLETKMNVLIFSFGMDNSATCRDLKLRYNEDTKKIRMIGIDAYYRATNYCWNFSYNLLTGKHITTKTSYENYPKETVTAKSGNTKSKPLFVEDINYVLFNKFDEMGNCENW